MIGFKWVLEKKLAGAGKPGLYDDIDKDLDFLIDRKFDVIVTLTEDPLMIPHEHSFKLIHFSIPDMGIPQPRPAYDLCLQIQELINEGHRVLVHCKAGLGRTGTILACMLVIQGMSSSEAIKKVRLVNRSYLQNALQENFIDHFEKFKSNILELD
uniref:protein-tyrosine phosphatase family protein n=1 Tax=Fulvivirga sp. TaxID=1931237 RepID=UPI0040494C58